MAGKGRGVKVIIDKALYPVISRAYGLGIPKKTIAKMLRMDDETLEREIRENEELGAMFAQQEFEIHGQVVAKAFDMAISGESPAMTMFWLKTRLGWKDTQHVEMSGKIDLEKLVLGSIEPPDKNKPVIDVKKIEKDNESK